MAEEVRWLDDDERETWLALMGVIVRLPAVLDAQLRRDAGLSQFEYQVLAGLSMAEGRTLKMTELATMAVSSLSRLSHGCTRLEAQGWVERSVDPANKRVKLARLTDAGYAKVVATAPGHVEEVRQLVFDPLSKAEVKKLRVAAHKILGATGPAPW